MKLRYTVLNAVCSPMHGIPVLLRDNIATGDQLHAASGAAAMLAWDPEDSISNHVTLTSIDQKLLPALSCRLMSA